MHFARHSFGLAIILAVSVLAISGCGQSNPQGATTQARGTWWDAYPEMMQLAEGSTVKVAYDEFKDETRIESKIDAVADNGLRAEFKFVTSVKGKDIRSRPKSLVWVLEVLAEGPKHLSDDDSSIDWKRGGGVEEWRGRASSTIDSREFFTSIQVPVPDSAPESLALSRLFGTVDSESLHNVLRDPASIGRVGPFYVRFSDKGRAQAADMLARIR